MSSAAARGLPALAAWQELEQAAASAAEDAQRASFAWRWSPRLAARLLREEALWSIPIRPPIEADALHLARLCLYRWLVHSRRGALRSSLAAALRRYLAAAGEDTADVDVLECWSAEWCARASERAAGSEEVQTATYVGVLAQLAGQLQVLRRAVDDVCRQLQAPSADDPMTMRMLTCLKPPAYEPFLLQGLVIEGDLDFTSRGEGTNLRAVADFDASVTAARRIVEGRRYGGPYHVAVRLKDAAENHALPFEGRSGGLALLAAFHFAVGHRNHLPRVVGFTGALDRGAVASVEGLPAKIDVVASVGIRVLFCPEKSEAGLSAQDRAGAAEAGVQLVGVPGSLRGGALIEWLEASLADHFPSLLRYEPERLHFFLARADGRVRIGGKAQPRAELRFLERVTRGDDRLVAQNIHAVALAGIGHTFAHEANGEEALRYLGLAEARFRALVETRRLDTTGLPKWLDLENLKAVPLMDLLRHDAAVALLRDNVAKKERLGDLCAKRYVGASLGSLGQALTYQGAARPACYPEAEDVLTRAIDLVEPDEQPRDRIYLATAELRAGKIDQAIRALEELLRTSPDPVTHRYAELRLREAYARSDDPEVRQAALRYVAAHPVEEPDPPDGWEWLRAMQRKWAAVIRARAGGSVPEALSLLTAARKAVAPPDGVRALHGDHPLAASCDLEAAAITARSGDLETSRKALTRALTTLAPFAQEASPADVLTLQTLLGEVKAALTTDAPLPIFDVARKLGKTIPY